MVTTFFICNDSVITLPNNNMFNKMWFPQILYNEAEEVARQLAEVDRKTLAHERDWVQAMIVPERVESETINGELAMLVAC